MNKPEQVLFHGVTMESMDPRVEPEDDKLSELSCSDSIGASRSTVDPWVRPEDDKLSFAIPGPSFVIPGLTGNPGVHA